MADISQSGLVLVLVGLVCMLSVQAMPADTETHAVEAVGDVERRATWLETRDLEQEVVQVVYQSLKKLVEMGLVNPDAVVSKTEEKRGRHQGFCFRKTKSGRFLPYICWKDGETEE